MSDDYTNRVCVLCAARGKTRRLETGHCCVDCAAWLATQVADIARLAADAAAWVTPGSSTGGGGHSVPSSRPPLNCDAVDPELTHIGPLPSPTVLEVVESWERMIRDIRGMAPYGVASSHRIAAERRHTDAHGTTTLTPYNETHRTLVGCTSFLGRQIPWMIDVDFPLQDFADEIQACTRVLRRWDRNAEHIGTVIKCPTINEDTTECGYRLHYLAADEHVTCRRCGATRDVAQLVYVAMSDGRNIWLDPEAAAQWLGVTEGTLRQWARKGRIQRDHGRYLIAHEQLMA